jgi:hypothetical protein
VVVEAARARDKAWSPRRRGRATTLHEVSFLTIRGLWEWMSR